MQKVKVIIMFILTVAMLLAGTSLPIVAITTELDSNLVLKMQLVLANNGVYLEGDNDVVVSLMNGVDNSKMWEKVFNDISINSAGEVTITIEGQDDSGVELATWMFDSTDLYLTVSVGGDNVDLDLLSQPYAIKSLISDVSYDASGIKGIEIKEVEVLEDNDILISNAGHWQPLGINDSSTGLILGLDKLLALESLTDINLDGIKEGDLIKFNGLKWENVVDHSMNSSEVGELLESKGYIQEFSIEDLQAGNYPAIIGIGATIRIASDTVYLMDHVEVAGNLLVFGNVGSSESPVNKVSVTNLTISDDESISAIMVNDYLTFTNPIKVTDKNGQVITGTGETDKVSVFTNDYTVGFDENLSWNSENAQLGINGLVDNAEVAVNIEGNLRVSNELTIQGERLSLDEYLKESAVSAITFSGSYNDLRNISNLDDFKSNQEFQNELTSYYTILEMQSLIDSKITNYYEEGLPQAIQEVLSGYETAQDADQRVEATLASSYFTEVQMDSMYYDDEEMSAIINPYFTDTEIEGVLLDYMLMNNMSMVGLSGDYEDLKNLPNPVVLPDFDAFKNDFSETYSDYLELTDDILLATLNLKEEVSNLIAQTYVTNSELINKNYGYQSEIDGLSELARTGDFKDVLNTPNLTIYMTKSELSEQFVSSNLFLGELSFYILDEEVVTVAKTAEYTDLLNYPDISLYLATNELDDYVLNETLVSKLDGVLKIGENIDLDLDDFMTDIDLIREKELYVLDGDMSAVAKSNRLADLLNSESIIMEASLSALLLDYLENSDMDEFEEDLNNLELSLEDELQTSLENIEASLTTEIASTLLNYEKSVTVDALINEKKSSFISNDFDLAMNNVLTENIMITEFNTLLIDYVTTQNLDDSLTAKIDDYVTTQNLEDQFSDYVTNEYLDTLYFFSTDGLDISIGGETIEISSNVVVKETSSLSGSLTANSAAIGEQFFNEYFTEGYQSPENAFSIINEIGGQAMVQMTSGLTGSAVTEGILIGINSDESMAVEINENEGLAIIVNDNNGFSISGDGNLGIGIDNPTFNIDISGDINVDGIIYNDGDEYEGSVFKRSEEDDSIAFILDENVYIGSEVTNSDHKLNVDGTIKASSFEGDASLITGVDSIPIGLIVMWSGAIADIPNNWALCNGQDNTPNLSGKFLVQYHGTSFPTVGATGGSSSTTLSESNLPSHSHSVTMYSSGYHYHRLSASSMDDHNHSGNGNRFMDVDAGYRTSRKSNTGSNSGDHSHSVSMSSVGSGQSFDNRPPYYVLAYIQYQGQ